MEAYKREFIQFLEGAGVLKFGDFTAKSGRKIPYFVNAGMIKTGDQITKMGEFYAKAYAEKIISLDEEISPVVLHHIGDILAKCGNIEKAVTYWQKALDAGDEESDILKRKIKYIKCISLEKTLLMPQTSIPMIQKLQ